MMFKNSAIIISCLKVNNNIFSKNGLLEKEVDLTKNLKL